jgi:hypothetical protein
MNLKLPPIVSRSLSAFRLFNMLLVGAQVVVKKLRQMAPRNRKKSPRRIVGSPPRIGT